MLKNSHVKSVGEMTDDDLKFDNCCKEFFFSDHYFFMTLAPNKSIQILLPSMQSNLSFKCYERIYYFLMWKLIFFLDLSLWFQLKKKILYIIKNVLVFLLKLLKMEQGQKTIMAIPFPMCLYIYTYNCCYRLWCLYDICSFI